MSGHGHLIFVICAAVCIFGMYFDTAAAWIWLCVAVSFRVLYKEKYHGMAKMHGVDDDEQRSRRRYALFQMNDNRAGFP
jgi:hypothetical protein